MTATTIPVPELGTEPPAEQVPLASAEPEQDQPKRRRRRRRTEPEPEQQAAPVVVSPEDLARTSAALTLAFQAVGALLGSRRGEHWRLKEEEAATLGDAWAAAIAPHLPKIGPAVPWATAAVITWTVFQPRLAEDQKRAKLAAAVDGGDQPREDT